jgi:hypothetical protein
VNEAMKKSEAVSVTTNKGELKLFQEQVSYEMLRKAK